MKNEHLNLDGCANGAPSSSIKKRSRGSLISAITNCCRNELGTLSFDGRFGAMRKPEEFTVYPMQRITVKITIQSRSRFGYIDLDTGEGVVSARHAGADSLWLEFCIAECVADVFMLTDSERQALRRDVKATGGERVGGIVKTHNIGALYL